MLEGFLRGTLLLEGFLIVTESFSYLVDDLSWDQGNGKQASILLLDASLADQLAETLREIEAAIINQET